MQLNNPLSQPRLRLAVPAGETWHVTDLGPNLHDIRIDAHVHVRGRALVVPTAEHTLWIEGVLLEDTPAGSTLKILAMESLQSAVGMPVVFAHAEVIGPDGQRFEERAGAFYAVVHNRAEVVARLAGEATWAAHAGVLKPFLLAGEIDWPAYGAALVITQLGVTA